MMEGFHRINGLAFAPDGRTAYFSDSFPEVRTIGAYDYDPDDGAWSKTGGLRHAAGRRAPRRRGGTPESAGRVVNPMASTGRF